MEQLFYDRALRQARATLRMTFWAGLAEWCAGLILGIAFLPVCCAGRGQEDLAQPAPVFRNTAPGVDYVGSAACARCHQAIYDQFMRTDMGRSISPAEASDHLGRVTSRVSIYDKVLGRYFEVFRDGNRLYQGEYALDAAGHELYRHTEKLAYAVGAGQNGWAYLVQRGNYLFQAPLSYYARTESWGLSPGHELGFNRAITAGCIACHSGRPQPIPDRDALYRRPAFAELSIGCENCHGPGQLHVEERLKGERLAGGPSGAAIDTSIVNPARLPNWLADNICMFCHQEGDARVLQPGKSYLDFRPGTPLHDTLVILMLPQGSKAQEQSPLLNHYSLMTASRCYRDSAGRLSCLTCHGAHIQPTSEDAPAYYRSKCLTCHTGTSCTLPVAERRRHTPPDDCAGCHMPKRELQSIAHSALTDHRIIRHAGEPYPEAILHETTPGLDGLLDLDREPGRYDSGLPPITLLVAFRQLSDRGDPYRSRYLALLNQAAPKDPNNPVVLAMLARQAALEGTAEGAQQAMADLSRAIQFGSAWPPDYDLLGTLLLRAGRPEEAIGVVSRGIALAPYTPSLYPLLAACYELIGQRSEAVDALKKGLGLFPEELSMREQLKKIESGGAAP
ncbi:MAG TPA: hypothetical protein VI455_16795 [Terriglobia bacterium]